MNSLLDLATSQYASTVLLTIVFTLALIHSVLGSIITGSIIAREKGIHPCFMCLFGCAIPLSMIGLGLSLFEHFDLAMRFMYGVVGFIVSVSYCAQHTKNLWQSPSSKELPKTGSAS